MELTTETPALNPGLINQFDSGSVNPATQYSADWQQLGQFVKAIFCRVPTGVGFISLRSFPDTHQGPPKRFTPVPFNSLDEIVQAAVSDATWCANEPEPTVFAPPVAVFNNDKTAKEADLLYGVELLVDQDGSLANAEQILIPVLGDPTIAVYSGGMYQNGGTAPEPKGHLHWRLAEPTATPEQHKRLKYARRLATTLVDADATSVPVVHPIRWPGSIHRKDPNAPKIVTMSRYNPEAEINLEQAISLLEQACRDQGKPLPGASRPASGPFDGGAMGDGDSRTDAELIQDIQSMANLHQSLVAMSARLVGRGMTQPHVIKTLQGYMELVPVESRDQRWKDRYDAIPTNVVSAVSKFASPTFANIKAELEAEAGKLKRGEKLPADHVTRFAGAMSQAQLNAAESAELSALIATHSHLDKRGVAKSVRALEAQAAGYDDEPTHHDIAVAIASNIERETSVRPVAADGQIWCYQNGIYKPLSLTDIVKTAPQMHNGAKNLSKRSDYVGVSKQVYDILLDPEFFNDAPVGVATPTQFLKIQPDGNVAAVALTPALRQRFTLTVEPDYTPPVLWLEFLNSTFAGHEPERQLALLQEVMGGVVFGLLPAKQVAVLLYGETQAGKSQVQTVISNLVHADFRVAISPYDWDDDRYVARLAGARLNLVGELEPDRGIPSGIFKSVTGGDLVAGRALYQMPFEFRNTAAHIFNSNYFVPCKDRKEAFFRRWRLLHFANTVPPEQCVKDLGQQIADAELPQILGWAIQGAQRLVAYGFTETETHRQLLNQWRCENSSVASFLLDTEFVVAGEGLQVSNRELFEKYRGWCGQNNRRPLGRSFFLREARLVSTREFGAREVRTDTNYFVGIGLAPWVLG